MPHDQMVMAGLRSACSGFEFLEVSSECLTQIRRHGAVPGHGEHVACGPYVLAYDVAGGSLDLMYGIACRGRADVRLRLHLQAICFHRGDILAKGGESGNSERPDQQCDAHSPSERSG